MLKIRDPTYLLTKSWKWWLCHVHNKKEYTKKRDSRLCTSLELNWSPLGCPSIVTVCLYSPPMRKNWFFHDFLKEGWPSIRWDHRKHEHRDGNTLSLIFKVYFDDVWCQNSSMEGSMLQPDLYKAHVDKDPPPIGTCLPNSYSEVFRESAI